MDLLDRLLSHDSWTTRQFLQLAASLADQQLDQDCGIGHRTVRQTLEHIIWNVECWTDLMAGDVVRHQPSGCQSIRDLMARFDLASAQFTGLARKVTDEGRLNERFRDTLDDPPQWKSIGTTIVHVATHGMHHRAQLLIMFRQLGIADLPEGDALSWDDAASATGNEETKS